MTAINITLPMTHCSSCNACIGHLMEDYKKMLLKLNTMISDGIDLSQNYPHDDFILKNSGIDNRNIYDSFIQIYHKYADEEDRKLFDIKAILIYSLLSYAPLTASDFPFRGIVRRYKWCCTRMFLCDPTLYP